MSEDKDDTEGELTRIIRQRRQRRKQRERLKREVIISLVATFIIAAYLIFM